MEQLLETFPKVDRIQEHYKSFVFQPDRVSINSFQDKNISPNPLTPYEQQTYSQFTNKLANPALNVKSLQLNRVTIPLPQTSIPNNECIFLYRRITANVNGSQPTFNEAKSWQSIRMVRLLRTDHYSENDPIFYNGNHTPQDYGFNRVFTDYQDLVNTLNKACQNDPADILLNPFPYFVPNDIKFGYDEKTNKIYWTPLQAIVQPPLNPVGYPYAYYTEVGYDDPDIPIFLKNAEQALNLTPGELTDLYQPLNVRLGFPWNGILNRNDPSFPTLIGYRMRPVPDFPGNPTNWQPILNYYAQAYANLVHTHNIFLYADIVGGSTQDTTSELPLLAIIPVTAPQLGVNVYDSKINAPLMKVPQHLYGITIQMRTDTGSPYELPNSAPVNIEISLFY